jgi:hypothetical protein
MTEWVRNVWYYEQCKIKKWLMGGKRMSCKMRSEDGNVRNRCNFFGEWMRKGTQSERRMRKGTRSERGGR